MIANPVIDEIRRMLREKRHSQRKIASRLGVSRGTVNSIATGKRPEYTARQNASNSEFHPPVGLPRRCPSCGAKVLMPCLACQIRALANQRKAGRQWDDSQQDARC